MLTAGAAVVFWPAAPVFLLMKGKDITINKGVTFDVYTDSNQVVSTAAAAPGSAPAPVVSAAQAAPPPAPTPGSGGTATVSITSSVAGADIEVDGAFVGTAPTTLQLGGGTHSVLVRRGEKVWQRSVRVNAGSTISLSATLQ